MLETTIDHLLIGSPSLEEGIRWLGERCGTSPTPGGSHPAQGTCNALLGLSGDRYLEVIAPDPQQAPTAMSRFLATLEGPNLLWWAARAENLDMVENALTDLGVSVAARTQGARDLPGVRLTLRWELLIPGSPLDGIALPFFIRWESMQQHPARALEPAGLLTELLLSAPKGSAALALGGPNIRVCEGKPGISAALAGHSALRLSSPIQHPPTLAELFL